MLGFRCDMLVSASGAWHTVYYMLVVWALVLMIRGLSCMAMVLPLVSSCVSLVLLTILLP